MNDLQRCQSTPLLFGSHRTHPPLHPFKHRLKNRAWPTNTDQGFISHLSGDECVWRESVRVKGDSSSPDFNHKRRSGESFMFAGLWIKNRLSHFFPLLQNTVHKCNKKNGRKACGSFIDLIISLLIFLLWEQLFHKHAWAEQWVQITALQKHLLEISKNRWKWKDFPISYFKKQKCGH